MNPRLGCPIHKGLRIRVNLCPNDHIQSVEDNGIRTSPRSLLIGTLNNPQSSTFLIPCTLQKPTLFPVHFSS
ncbi:Uncharacterised protein [Chlamydia trachomatis]|nr:Uncharacterised protein [Chlamydia trachomatis]